MAKLNDIILIPTDFSEVCDNAVEHAVQLAKSLSYRVFLLHVINKDTNKYLKAEELNRESISEKLESISKKYEKKHDTPVEYLIKGGNLFEKIADVSEKLSPRLIILGTHGKMGFQKITGSYVLKIVTTTGVPTIIVQKRSFEGGYGDIVFPITSQTQDRQKLNWAIQIAQTFESTVHLLPKFEAEKFYKNKIMTVTKQIKSLLNEYNIKYVDKVSEPGAGNFAKQVIDYAVENEAELIMTLVNKDKSFFFSSWDEQIIYNSSQIPVICINPISTKKTSWR
ncbi:MAG: universal stress protein [Bacteroidota bacterium]|nr:universal stress protein [Bacteroidota bacterium]